MRFPGTGYMMFCRIEAWKLLAYCLEFKASGFRIWGLGFWGLGVRVSDMMVRVRAYVYDFEAHKPHQSAKAL